MIQETTRLYCFAHQYLSQIQRGIQASHLAVEMMLNNNTEMVDTWANRDKTIIILNGGNSSRLRETWKVIADVNDFPYSWFHEDEDSLDGALTTVGVILPQSLFNVSMVRDRATHSISYYYRDADHDTTYDKQYDMKHRYFSLIDTVKSASLA